MRRVLVSCYQVPSSDCLRRSKSVMCPFCRYTNVDDEEAATKLGLCGGGVYRELQVYVDGQLAGASYPFPVVYTGGINPFLWRPLTGIMSFDIPDYSFDLSPWDLSDGKPHTITVLVDGGDDQGGVWYLDAALLLYRQPSYAPIRKSITSTADSRATEHVSSGLGERDYSWNTTGQHTYSIISAVTTGSGLQFELTISGKLSGVNNNTLTNRFATQLTAGRLFSVTNTSLHSLSGSRLNEIVKHYSGAVLPDSQAESSITSTVKNYTLLMNSTYLQDADSFDMQASVALTYDNTDYFHTNNAGYSINWGNTIASSAKYNRSTDHSEVYVEEYSAVASYYVFVDGSPAYKNDFKASEGFIDFEMESGQVDNLPGRHYICGYSLCRSDACADLVETANQIVAVVPVSEIDRSGTIKDRSKGKLFIEQKGRLSSLARLPLMGRAQLAWP